MKIPLKKNIPDRVQFMNMVSHSNENYFEFIKECERNLKFY